MPTVVHLIPTLQRGGAERQMAMLAAEQSRRGWGVHVAFRRGGIHQAQIQRAGGITHELGDFKGPHPLVILRIASLLRRVNPDLVQTWLPQMDILGGAIARLLSVPWVLSERASEEAYEGIPYWVRRRVASRASAVVANSIEGQKYWKKANCAVDIVTNAVDLQSIQSADPSYSEGTDSRFRTFLSVGRLAPQKAPEILLEAAAAMPPKENAHLVLIGDGPLRQSIEDTIRARSLDDRVKLVTYSGNWWGLLKTAVAFVSTSRFEGQPNAVLEAMAAGCPLIVSDIPSHRAILDEESAIIVKPDDASGFAKAMMSVLSCPEEAQQKARRASRRVAAFTINSTADAYERIYANVLRGRAL